MKWKVLIDGKPVWVNQQPIWRVHHLTGKEIGIGYLPDGTKVKKITKWKKGKKNG